jgi:hypothetical protein
MIDAKRRELVKLTALSCLLPTGTLFANSNSQTLTETHLPTTLISCYDDPQGKHFVALFNSTTGQSRSFALSHRGHGIILNPDKTQALIFSRRPDTLFWIIDLAQQQIINIIHSPTNRHFYGHGIFEPTARYLYVAENNYASGQGIIGVYDAHQQYQRVTEFSSHGIGPHELAFLSDGLTLVVANGGIKTHPDLGRSKLNLATMQANLAYFIPSKQQFIKKYTLAKEYHQLSIRHLSVGANDTVSIAMQYQGSKQQHPPLLALHQANNPKLTLISAPNSIQKQMKNYCGSICHDSSGQFFAMSAPRGGLISFWDNTGHYLHHLDIPDGCGLTKGNNKGEIVISSGQGLLMTHQIQENHSSLLSTKNPNKHWDNHLLSVINS